MSIRERIDTSYGLIRNPDGSTPKAQQTSPRDGNDAVIDIMTVAKPEVEKKNKVGVGNFHDTRKTTRTADQLAIELKSELLQLIGKRRIGGNADPTVDDNHCDVIPEVAVNKDDGGSAPFIVAETRLTSASVDVSVLPSTSTKKYQCAVCPFTANIKSKLVTHERSHSGVKPFKCSECSFAAAHKSHLNRHKRLHTGDVFKCPLCPYVATDKSYLITHNRIHTGEKPFQCSECSFRSAHKATMNVHVRAHAGKKPMRPFQCSDCSYSATCRSKMIIHQRSHTGEKPFQCPECSFAAPQKSLLKKHQRMHMESKPFVCTECKFASAYKGNLTKHMKTHTKKFFK